MSATKSDGSTGTIIGGPFSTPNGKLTMSAAGLSGLIGDYTMTYNVSVVRAGTTPFTFSSKQDITLAHGDLASIMVAGQPSSGSATGDVLNVTPIVELHDGSGNIVTGYANTPVTASLVAAATDAAPTGTAQQEVISSTATVNAIAGVADFANLKVVGIPGTSYKLLFSMNGVTSVLSNALSVTHAAAASISVTQDPIAGQKSGTVFTQAPKVSIKDAYGNLVTSDSTSRIITTITSGANGELNDKATVQVVGGVATFGELTLAGLVSEHYKLKFALEGTSFETAGPPVLPRP
jgi:hypothetical protein